LIPGSPNGASHLGRIGSGTP